MQELFHLHFTLLYTSVSFILVLELLKEAMKPFRTISCTPLPSDLIEKETLKQRCKNPFYLHFIFLFTSVIFFLFLEHLKEAMKLFRIFSCKTILFDWRQNENTKQRCKNSFMSTWRSFFSRQLRVTLELGLYATCMQ